MLWRSDSGAREKLSHHRPGDDLHIELQRPVLDVVEIVVDARDCGRAVGGAAAATVDLRQSGNARAHHVTLEIVGDQVLIRDAARQHAWHVRPRPNQRHVALHHIDQLGEFIEARLPQQAADTGHARIVGRGLRDARCVVEMRVHGPELVDPEQPVSLAVARLPEEDRPRGVDPDGDRDAGEQRREEQEGETRSDDIEQPLDRVARRIAPHHRRILAAGAARSPVGGRRAKTRRNAFSA